MKSLSNHYDNDGYSSEVTISVEKTNDVVTVSMEEFTNQRLTSTTAIHLDNSQVEKLIVALGDCIYA